MKVYHATTEKNWKEIQKDKILWGRKNKRNSSGKLMSRVTYLALKKEDAHYDFTNKKREVLLEVEIPAGQYPGDHWQIRFYESIPVTQVKRINMPD